MLYEQTSFSRNENARTFIHISYSSSMHYACDPVTEVVGESILLHDIYMCSTKKSNFHRAIIFIQFSQKSIILQNEERRRCGLFLQCGDENEHYKRAQKPSFYSGFQYAGPSTHHISLCDKITHKYKTSKKMKRKNLDVR